MSKKKIIAIVLFVFMGLFMFAFANPSDEDLRSVDGYSIEVNPSRVIILEGEDYDVMEGVTTNSNKKINASIEDTTVLEKGEHKVIYTLDGETTTGERTIVVVDPNGDLDNDGFTNKEEKDEGTDLEDDKSHPETVAPRIYLNAPNPYVMLINERYTEPGYYIVLDPHDKITTVNDVVVRGTIDVTKSGNYVLTYSITDRYGKTATTTRTITVNERTYYTVDFVDYDLSVLKSESVERNTDAVAPTDPVRAGYTFTGWDTAFTNVQSNLKVTAQYTANTDTKYTVKYLLEELDGTYKELTTAREELTGTTDTEVTVTASKTFEGFTAPTTSVKGIIVGDGSLVLELKYTRNSYTLTVDNNNGTVVVNKTLKYGATIETPTTPTKAGYTFTSWNPAIPATMPASNLKVTAQYTANTDTAYTVEYYLQNLDGTTYQKETTENKTGSTNAEATYTTPSKEGYTYEKVEYYEGTTKTTSTKINANGTTVVKVYYTRNSYTLTVDNNNGTVVVNKTLKYGATIETPTTPTKAGYTFTSWNPAIPATMPASNLKVTAQYTANTDTAYIVIHIKLNSNNQEVARETENKTGTTDETATYATKNYTGYTYNSTKYYNNTTETTSTNINANGTTVVEVYYKILVYKVKFVGYNDANLGEYDVEHGSSVTPPTAPSVDLGYVTLYFNGWDSTAYNNVTSNVTITAKYGEPVQDTSAVYILKDNKTRPANGDPDSFMNYDKQNITVQIQDSTGRLRAVIEQAKKSTSGEAVLALSQSEVNKYLTTQSISQLAALNTNAYAIEWYVLKYNSGDGWHLDGQRIYKDNGFNFEVSSRKLNIRTKETITKVEISYTYTDKGEEKSDTKTYSSNELSYSSTTKTYTTKSRISNNSIKITKVKVTYGQNKTATYVVDNEGNYVKEG